MQFLAHLSRRLKRVFLIKICPLSVVVVVANFSHFHLLLQNQWANFKETWRNVYLGDCSNEGPTLFQGEIIAKIHCQIYKIFFSRTAGPISTKLGTNRLLVKGIQVCSNEGPRPFPWGDNYKFAKIHDNF